MYNKQMLSSVFIENRSALHRYIARFLGNSHDAEDIVQETWVRLMQSDSLGSVEFPKALIYRVARNIAVDYLRRASRGENILSRISHSFEEAPDIGPQVSLIEEQERAILKEAVAKLPIRCRNVYELRSVHGMSHNEIAEQLDISVRTVENHIAKATKNCRNYLVHSSVVQKDDCKSARIVSQ